MKKILLIISITLLSSLSFAQNEDNNIENLTEKLKASGKSDDAIKEFIEGLLDKPELYNEMWQKFVSKSLKTDSAKWKYLNDLNLKFKTFQTDAIPIGSLGLSYDFNFDWANFSEKGESRTAQNFGLTANGNVAFDKAINPNDFLETKINYSYSWFSGGVIKNSQADVFDKLNTIEDKLVTFDDPNSAEALKLWKEFGEYLQLSNQYYFSVKPKMGLESNQDFSKTQLAPGLQLSAGAKAWSNNTTLAKLNVFDYPFAFIRFISGVDPQFTPYGSTIPTVQFGLDYIVPNEDTIRAEIVGNEDPYLRTKVEASFRTYVSKIKDQRIYFNANFRYYQELDADAAIQAADLDEYTYFVMALQSSSGFFVSYADGKLPFDAQTDKVYSLGFNYKF